ISLSYFAAAALGAIFTVAVIRVHNVEPIPVPTQSQLDEPTAATVQPVATSIQADPLDYTRNHNRSGGVILEHRREGKMEDGRTPLPTGAIGAPLPGNQSRSVPVKTASLTRELTASNCVEHCSCENCACASSTPLRTAAIAIAAPV